MACGRGESVATDDQYWDVRMETLPVQDRLTLHDHRLQWQVRRCWDGSPFYRARLSAARIEPPAFVGLSDLSRLPLLTIEDVLADETLHPPHGRFTVAPTTWWIERELGRPEPRRVWTDGDVSHRADLAARALWAAGARPGRPIDLSIGPDDPSLARALDAAIGRIAATTTDGYLPVGMRPLRVSSDRSSRRSDLSRRAEADVDVIWRLGETVEDGKAEGPMSVFGIPFVGPTLAHGCPEQSGLHWAQDHLLVEIVDPASGASCPPGVEGRLVLTELTREGSPLIRFATEYVTVLDDTACGCGRTSARSPFVRPLR